MFFAAVLLAAACSDSDPSPEAIVTDVRILAVQAEPPVIATTETARLSSLVVSGQGTRNNITVTYRACYPWAPLLSPREDCGPESSIPITNRTFSPADVVAAFPPPPEVVAQIELARARSEERPCDAAFSAWEFPIIAEVRIGGVPQVTSKRIRVALDDLVAPRTNPRIESLVFDGVGMFEASPQFVAGTEHELSVAVARDSVDAVCAEEAGEVELEELDVRFYATAGEFIGASIDVELGQNGEEAIGSTLWSATDVDLVFLWMVITDGEGGISWKEIVLSPLNT